MTYDLPCRLCGESVQLSRQTFLRLVRERGKPVCRRNGCYRYGRERRGGRKIPGVARESQGVIPTHVARVALVSPSSGPSGSALPLAKWRVGPVSESSCGDKGATSK